MWHKHNIFALFLCVCCAWSAPKLDAASAWQKAEQAASLAETDMPAAINALQSLLLDDQALHVAHYNLACLLLNYQWQAEDEQRFGEQTRALAKQALQLSELPEIDPLALAAEHFTRASSSPVVNLSARSFHNLALARYKQGRLEEALSAAVRACELLPKNTSFIQTRDELRRVYLERLDEARRKAEEEAKRLRIVTTQLPPAFVGKKYKAEITARAGAGAPYQFTLGEDVKLPTDLTFHSNGQIDGIPNADGIGEHELACIVKDKADATDEQTVRLKVWPKARIITEQVPEAIINQSYQAQLQCEGFPNAQWLIDGLPEGLTLKGNGSYALISGTTDKIGRFPLSITVKDKQHDLIAVQRIELIASDSFAPDTSDMPDATAWAAYQHHIRVRGPVQSYTFMSSGAGGLSIDEQGRIGGTPEQAGTLEIPLTIVAENKQERSFLLQLTVHAPPVIDEEEQIELETGRSLQRALKVKGGTPPYIWALKEGLLPDGVRLDPNGVISGAASQAEEAPVTISIEDRWSAQSSKEITLIFKHSEAQKDQQENQEQQEQEEQDQQQEQENQNAQNEPGDGNDQQQGDKNQQDQQQPGDQEQQAQQDKNQNKEKDDQTGQQSQAAQAEQAAEQERQAAQIKQADIQRWLDGLPEESKRALLMQLLSGQQPADKEEEPW